MIRRASRLVHGGLRQASRLLLAALLPALAGCGGLTNIFPSSSDSGPGPAAELSSTACPTTVILRPLANTATFGPGNVRRPENVAFYGVLSDTSNRCRVDNGTLRMALDVVVIGERGPAGKGNAIDLNYFVAVTGPDQRILSKKPFSVHITLEGTAKRAGVTDHIEEAVPLDSTAKVADLAVDVGFQQTPDAIEFYKRFRGR